MSHPEIIAILQILIDWTWGPIFVVALIALVCVICGMASAASEDDPRDF